MKKIIVFCSAILVTVFVQAQTQELDKLRVMAANEPSNAQHWLKLGKAADLYAAQMRAKGDVNAASTAATEAQDYFQMAIGIAPRDAQMWKEVGLHYYQKEGVASRKAHAAIAFLQRAEAYNPNDLDVLAALQQAYGQIGQTAKAQVFGQRIQAVKAGAPQSAYHKF